MNSQSALWSGEAERLDRALAHAGLARSRSQAAELIVSGRAKVDGVTCTKTGTKVREGSSLTVERTDHYVSRAAHKLITGLNAFAVDPHDRLVADLGASTGGFTQVLLERGSRHVFAIDVGHDQLVTELRRDPRVTTIEGCNARELTKASLAELAGTVEQPTLIVGDLSFISLTLVLPAMVAIAAPHAEMVLLIKPQFEVGRSGIRDGIVVDPLKSADAVANVIAAAQALGLVHRGLEPSPLTGEHGNQEFLAYFERGGS